MVTQLLHCWQWFEWTAAQNNANIVYVLLVAMFLLYIASHLHTYQLYTLSHSTAIMCCVSYYGLMQDLCAVCIYGNTQLSCMLAVVLRAAALKLLMRC